MSVHVELWVGGQRLHAGVDPSVHIGREAESGTDQIAIDHPLISRAHLTVSASASGIVLKDVGSTNGTFGPDGRFTELSLGVGNHRVSLGPPPDGALMDIRITAAPTAPTSAPPTPPPAAPTSPPPGPAPTPSVAEVASTTAAIGEISAIYRPDTTTITIGRDPSCTVTLTDTHASRLHATLTVDASGARVLKDEASQNGLFVNGERVTTAAVRDGDVITIGQHHLVVQGNALQEFTATQGLEVRAEGLTVVVGNNLTILDNVNFTLPAGSMTAVLGPSGSGKSTLLGALTGRRPATAGRVLLDGWDLYAQPEQLGRRIGLVPQTDDVHELLTTRRALAYAAELRLPADTSRKEVAAVVDQVAETLSLTERLDTRIDALSGGQKKRVSVGYELVGGPQLLILDEPTSGLDPGLERSLMTSLKTLTNEGTSVVVVTHSVASMELCDLVIVLAPGGRLAFVGPPAAVARHFHCNDLADVFHLLNTRTDVDWQGHFGQSSQFQAHVAAPSRAQQRALQQGVRRPFFHDYRKLVGRSFRGIVADRRALLLLALQAPILGAILAALLSKRAFVPAIVSTTKTREYILAVVMAIAWIGASNSVRELVRERPAFIRERAVGVSPTAWVLAKWTVLGIITILQAAALHAVASSRQRSRPPDGLILGNGDLELVVAIVGVGLACVGVGLLISAVVDNATKAMTLLPLALIPLLLVSGLLVPTAGRPGLEQISWAMPTQWGASTAAATTSLLDQEGCNAEGIELEIQKALLGNTIACDNPRWVSDTETQQANLAGLAGSIVVLLVLSAGAAHISLRRRAP